VEPCDLGVVLPGEGLVHSGGRVEGVVDQEVAGEALVDPPGFVLVASEVHDPPGPLEAMYTGESEENMAVDRGGIHLIF